MSDVSTAEFDTGSGPDPKPDAAGGYTPALSRQMAGRFRKEVHSDLLPKLTHEAFDSEIENVPEGSDFIDPEGTRRTRPYQVRDEMDIARVPEGATFMDPEGELRQKPRYEGIDYTAQTLYDIATNDRERRKALERSYAGKVKEGPEGLYVEDDDGKLRRPKGLSESGKGAAAALTGMAAPTIGAIGGEILGGLGANLPGAVGGAFAGGAAGQGFNDVILGLSGVYDRSIGEEARELGKSGVLAGGGTALGRVVAPAVAAKGGIKNAAPGILSHFLGADEKGLDAAISMREKGVPVVPPSMWAMEAPALINSAEVFDPAFRTQQPLMQAARAHYERQAASLVHDTGVSREDSLFKPTEAVPTKETGEAVRRAATEQHLTEMAEADGKLAAEVEQAKLAAEQRVAMTPEQKEGLRKAEIEATGKANLLIRTGFDDIDQSVQDAMTVAKAGHNSGDLWWQVGEKLKALRAGVGQRARIMYDQWENMTAGHVPNSEDLPDTAKQFLDQLPEGFASRYPTIVQKMRDIAGVPKLAKDGTPTGEWVKEPVQPTYAQLHNLRTDLRSNINYYDLPSDIKNGTYKFFQDQIDQIIHDTGGNPALEEASQFLRKTDAWYADNIAIFNAKNLKTVMDGLRAGEPADPEKLSEAILRAGYTDQTKKILDMIGPQLGAAVRAADVQSMLDASMTHVPGQVDGAKFAKEVLERKKNKMLWAVHGQQMGDKLSHQAQMIEALEGRIPVQTRPGDTAMDIIGKARTAAETAKEAAKQDPLKVLQSEMKKIEENAKQVAAKRLQEKKAADPLSFLWDPTVGAMESVDRILASEDLIIAASGRFGKESSEFNMLQQVWTQRMLQSTLQPSKRLAKVSPEVQNLMFPGVRLDEMHTLTKEMDFLLASKAANMQSGKSMAAQAKVNNPITSVPGVKVIPKLVGANFVARGALNQYYKMVTTLANNVAFMKWVQKGLKGDPAARQMVREQVQRAMQVGGAVGAGAAEATYQAPSAQGAQ